MRRAVVDAATPADVAGKTPAVSLIDTEARIDMRRLRAYRLGRTQRMLRADDLCAAVLFDPINIRYATGSRNMAVWTLHNPTRYAFVPAEGKPILFEFPRCEHLSAGLETIGEVRPATSWTYMSAGPRLDERAMMWADEIADLVSHHGGANRRLAVDHANAPGVKALEGHGVEVVGGQAVIERARIIKSADEVACMNHAIAVTEAGMAGMRAALRPGVSENELWSILHRTNIAKGGEFIETRLLASGHRTNPWYQECSDKLIRAGELVAYDTDLVGPLGYSADISRTHFCGPGRPSDEQRRLYGHAHEQIMTNIGLLKPGLSFREFSEQSWRLPNEFVARRYTLLVHGVGMCNEYPAVPSVHDWQNRRSYDGVFEENMTVCVESYIGSERGGEGVKLEEQVLITAAGAVPLSTFPYEDELLA